MSVPDITLMVYFAADNNLASEAQENLNDFIEGYTLAGYPANLTIHCLMDSTELGEHYILTVSNGNFVRTDLAENPNTGSSETLAWFVDTAMTASPDSDLYSLLLWNHGGGIAGAMSDDQTGDTISVPGIVDAIKDKNIGVLGFDACLMAAAEMTVELNNSGVSYLVASEEVEGGSGWDYSVLARKLAGATSEYELAEAFWESAVANQETIDTISVSDLALAGQLSDAMNRFAEAALKLESTEFDGLVSAVNASLWFGNQSPMDELDNDYVSTDIADFLQRLKRRFDGDAEIAVAADELLGVINEMVVLNYSRGFYRADGGISVSLAVSEQAFWNLTPYYAQLQLSENNSYWFRFVRRLAGELPDADDRVRLMDTGLEILELPDESFAYDLGFFSGGGATFRYQAVFAKEEPFRYRVAVAAGQEPGADGWITVRAAGTEVELSYKLTDQAGNVIASGSGTEELKISGTLLVTGEYLLAVAGDTDSYFTISFDGERVHGIDRYEYVTDNNELERATVVGYGFHTGQMTASDDPDYYKLAEARVVYDYLTVSGDGFDSASITIRVYDEENRYWDAAWNESRGVYTASLENAAYFVVLGNDDRVTDYDFNVSISNIDAGDSGLFFWGDFAMDERVQLFTDSQALQLEYGGYYSLSPENCFLDGFSVRITLLDEQNRKVASVSSRKGELSSAPLLLAAGNYTVKVEKLTRNGEGLFYFDFTTEELFRKANQYHDDWAELKQLGAAGLTQVDNAPPPVKVQAGTEGVFGDWVGFGDTVDYREVTIDTAGEFFFGIEAGDNVVLSLCELQERKNGTYRLKTLKSTRLTVRGDEGGTRNMAGILLEKGTYYFSVRSTNASRGGDADYGVTVDLDSTRFFSAAENGDDDWKNLEERFQVLLDDSERTVFNDEWVGFGDLTDYRKLEVAASGSYTLQAEAGGKARYSLYLERSDGKLVLLKSVTVTAKRSVAAFRDILLDSGSTYYVMARSTDGKRGGEASYQMEAEWELHTGIDLAAAFAADYGFERGETVQLTFQAEGDALSFESFGDFNLQLFRYNEKNNRLLKVGIRKNEVSGLDGTYYLRLTAKTEVAGQLVYDSSDNLFSWRETAGPESVAVLPAVAGDGNRYPAGILA